MGTESIAKLEFIIWLYAMAIGSGVFLPLGMWIVEKWCEYQDRKLRRYE